jgi:hypothetical protein
MQKPAQQLNFRIKKELLEQAKQYVDGILYRSVGHILNMALMDWIIAREREKEEEQRRDDNGKV